jgi:hypothetical protein
MSSAVHMTSARAEAWGVARALFHIGFWSALFVSAQTYRADGAWGVSSRTGPATPSPFERRFQDLPSADQRTYRALRVGLSEAERVRAATGRWPSVAALASNGVPPFAPDPIDHAGYTWRLIQTGLTADYIGVPRRESGREAFFAIVVEPEPGTADDPLVQPDEIHHRLANGTMIHATVWVGPPLAERGEAFAVLPVERGYRQIVGGR